MATSGANSKTQSSKTEPEQQSKLAPRKLESRNSDLSSSANDPDKPVKRLPPIKAPVGLAKGPDLKNCKSKVGSLHNIKHAPQSSGVTIPTQKLVWNAKPKVGSLENKQHKPGGGKLKVETRKLDWKTTSKVQSLANVNHKPGGGNVKIFNEAYTEKAEEKNGKKNGEAPNENNNLKSKNELTQDMKNLSLKK